MDEANEIKTEIGDVQGIAMNRGITAGYYLFTMNDPATALELYVDDLEVVVDNNLTSDLPKVWNYIASCHLRLINTESTERAHASEALVAATHSISFARRTSRTFDYSFAISNVTEAVTAIRSGEPAAHQAALDGLVDELNVGETFVTTMLRQSITFLPAKTFCRT